MTTEGSPRELPPLKSSNNDAKEDAMPPPATYTRPHRNRSCCGFVFATLCSVLLLVLFLLGVATLIAWLVLRPIHEPGFSLDDLQLTSFSLTPQSLVSLAPRLSLDANLEYTVTVNNPNKRIGFKYGEISIETSYSGDVFGRSVIPAFYQGHRNITTLTADLEVENYAINPSLGLALATDVRSGSIPLLSRASSKVRVRIGGWTSVAVRVRVRCDIRVSPPSSSGPGRVVDKTCKVTR